MERNCWEKGSKEEEKGEATKHMSKGGVKEGFTQRRYSSSYDSNRTNSTKWAAKTFELHFTVLLHSCTQYIYIFFCRYIAFCLQISHALKAQ